MRNALRQLGRALCGAPSPTVCDPPYPSIDLFSWAPANGARNFGDHLSRIVVAAVAARSGLTLEDEVVESRRMLGIGSILHFARDGDVIWGSGINGKIPLDQLTARRLDVRAVRGPKTAAILRERGHHVPDVYGDPALLIPHIFNDRFIVAPSRDHIVVPNLHDLALVSGRADVVSPLLGWNRCVEAICQARFVVASSLHGIILAEAFGIPARYVRLSETEDRFKYDDYAQGSGRAELAPARSIEEALDLGPHDPIAFDPRPLLEAFPRDLWAAG